MSPAFSPSLILLVALPALLLALVPDRADASPAVSSPEAVDDVINVGEDGDGGDEGAHERFARASPLRWGKRASNQVLRWGKREPLRWGKRSIGSEGHSRSLREAPLRSVRNHL